MVRKLYHKNIILDLWDWSIYCYYQFISCN